MAQKIKLGNRPKSFKRTITFGMVEGGEGSMELTYQYRSRKELAKLADEVQAVAQAQHDADIEAIKEKAAKSQSIEPLKQVDLLDRGISLQVDYLMQVVEGWNLDEKFCRAAVEQLADEVPDAITVAIETYRKAINEGRLGN